MQKLTDLLCDVLECNEAQLNSTEFKNLETWNSLKYMTLVMQLEENFGTSLSADEIQQLTSLAEVKKVLSQKGINA